MNKVRTIHHIKVKNPTLHILEHLRSLTETDSLSDKVLDQYEATIDEIDVNFHSVIVAHLSGDSHHHAEEWQEILNECESSELEEFYIFSNQDVTLTSVPAGAMILCGEVNKNNVH